MNHRHTVSIVFCFLALSLNLCFGQQPKLVLPIGHSDWILDAKFSPNGKTIVTASKDNTAKIWETETGALLINLKDHNGWVFTAIFSPDGKKIVTASEDGTAKLWDAQSGAVLADFNKHIDIVMSAIFSNDGKKVLTASEDNTSKLWDAETGNVILDLKGHTGWVYSSYFSPDGKKIVTASWDSTAKIWDAISGKLLVDLRGHTGHLSSARFSPDGKKIITSSSDKTAKIWDAQSGRLLADLKGHTGFVYSASFSPDGKKIVTASEEGTAKLWDAQSGVLLFDLSGHKESLSSAFFSPACPGDPIGGKKIVTTSFDSTIKIWDTETGVLLLDLKGHEGPIYNASFSADGQMIITASWDRVAKIWDAKRGSLLADLKGHSSGAWDATYSFDGKKIVVTSGNNTATIWNAQNGRLLFDIKGHTGRIGSARFSPDGKYIVTASLDSTAKIWDATSGKLLGELKGHTKGVIGAKYSPDGKFIVTVSRDSTVKIWDVQTGKILADLKGHEDEISGVSFSSDGKRIVTASDDRTAKIWDAQNGKLQIDLKGHTGWLYSALFSPDGKTIATASSDSTVKIWDGQSGILLKTMAGHTDEVYSVSFSFDNKMIVTASADNTAKLWDIQSGKLISNLNGHTNMVSHAKFSPDGKKIITTSGDLTSKIWDINTGLLYTFFVVNNSDYLIVDKNNHYDGTEAARKMLYFTCASEIIELDQVKDQLWVPNLAERILKGDSINAKTLNQLSICGLTPLVEDASTKVDEYFFKITPRRGGLGETVLFVNGIEAKRYKPSQLLKIDGQYQLRLKKVELDPFFIAGKKNPIIVKAYTSNNAISSRGVIIQVDQTKELTTPPNLYAVMVGVSDYKGNELDLAYAAKDATDISSAIANAARKLLNTDDGNEHVLMYNLTTAANHYQLPEKNSIKKVLEEIGKKATANDILLIFFAGHGVMTGEADKKQFYFLTADASMGSITGAITEVGISTSELTEWMKPQNIKAQKRILIFDACNSGQAINDFVKMGKEGQDYVAARNDDKAQQIKAIDKLNEKSGLFILSASATNQSAYEMGRYSQGLLTYSLLRAIKQQPDILNQGKYLDVSRWFNAAKESVSDLAKEGGARQEPQIVSNTNFNIGIVDEEVIAKIILPAEKPLFASCNFQNGDENILADDLGLNKLIDQQLNEIATRGIEASIAYAPGSNSPDAFTLSGRYIIKDSTINIKVFIRQNNVVKNKIDLTGTKDKLKEFAALIASKTAEWASTNK